MPKALITGSSGFVGSQVIEHARNLGWEVIGIGRRQSSATNYFSCDLSLPFPSIVCNAIRDVDVVIHAAARSSPWGSAKQFKAANVTATQNLLNFFEGLHAPKFVFISSSSVYYRGEDQLGITEETPLAEPAVNMYAHTKQVAERLVRNYPGPKVILRPRAVYGRGDTVLFPRILKAAQAGRLPLLTRSGTPVIGDLISIHNLVPIIVAAASRSEISGEYNLTDDHPVEIIEFLLDVFEQLEIQRPTRRLSVRAAFRIADTLEMLHRVFFPWVEPAITRFGVHVFAYSKTFDVTKMKTAFGQPTWSVKNSVEDFANWIHTCNPYGLA